MLLQKNEYHQSVLCFKVLGKIEPELSQFYGDSEHKYEKSSTIFINPNVETIKEFRKISDKVLEFQKKYSITSTRDDSVSLIDYNGGKVYVRGLLIPEVADLKDSYHFSNYDIPSRDRSNIPVADIKSNIRKLLEQTENRTFIQNYLSDAVIAAQKGDVKLDFRIEFTLEAPILWIEEFKERFGSKTAIRCQTDQDMNAVHMAQHMDLEMVTLPDVIANSLMKMRGPEGEIIPSYHSELGDVFVHEADHDITHAKDAEPKFRDFLTGRLSELIAKEIPDEVKNKLGYLKAMGLSQVLKGEDSPLIPCLPQVNDFDGEVLPTESIPTNSGVNSAKK